MAVKVIKEGDKERQGNASCPQCGEKVLIENHFGDPPKCSKCGVPYVSRLASPKYH